jgi:hypothetical protein
MKQMKNEVNFGEIAETLAMAHTYVAKSMISERQNFGCIIIETQMWSLSSNWFTL